MESNQAEGNIPNLGEKAPSVQNNNLNDESYANFNDDFDYEKIQAILEEVKSIFYFVGGKKSKN
jgi:hypothetical protein